MSSYTPEQVAAAVAEMHACLADTPQPQPSAEDREHAATMEAAVRSFYNLRRRNCRPSRQRQHRRHRRGPNPVPKIAPALNAKRAACRATDRPRLQRSAPGRRSGRPGGRT